MQGSLKRGRLSRHTGGDVLFLLSLQLRFLITVRTGGISLIRHWLLMTIHVRDLRHPLRGDRFLWIRILLRHRLWRNCARLTLAVCRLRFIRMD